MTDATSDEATGEAAGIVDVTALSSEGDGVARLPDGRVAFVAGGVPGDRVTLDVQEERKRFVRARIDRLVESSPHRTEPRCPHAGVCGGCLWQHIDYEAQLEAKRQAVSDALTRIGGLTLDAKIEIVPSPSPYAYRARARWVECEEGLGYRVRAGAGAVAVDVCPVLVPGAEAALTARTAELRAASDTSAPSRAGSAAPATRGRPRRRREWVVTTGSDGVAIVTPAGSRQARRRRPGEARSVTLEIAGERLRVGGDSFVQANALLWDALVLAVRDACLGADASGSRPAGGDAPKRFVELYAGVGFFTLALARAGLEGVAIESDRAALTDLTHNLRVAQRTSAVEVVAGRVETRGDLEARFRGADLALVDPPRTGLAPPVRDALAAAGPARLVYLSCDPGTLARDLAGLVAAGYAVAAITAYDLFPQTPHVETLVVLERAPRAVR